MARLDDRLRRDLERAGRPADPTGVYETLIRRRERRRITRGVRSVALTVAVTLGSLVGIWALSRVFGVGEQPRPSAPGSELGSIAVTWARGFPDPEHDLALVSTDDGGVTPLTSGTELDELPAWSPDGATIAFWRASRDGSSPAGIYTMPAVGGEPALLLRTDLSIWAISWSPQGDRIAFVGVEPADGTELDLPMAVYTVAADGSDLRQLTSDGQVMDVAWSPDGERLAITRQYALGENRVGHDISVLDRETGEEQRLTHDGTARRPSWSPDGTRIAFTSSASGEVRDMDLYVMDADGSNRSRLTTTPQNEEDTAWAPDGTAVAVTRFDMSDRNAADCDLVLFAPDGSTERILVDGPIDGFCPISLSWQPAPAAGGQAPPPVPTQTGRPPQAAEDIGLGFPVCNITSIDGPFVDPNRTATVLVATRMSSAGECPDVREAFNVIALDVDADGIADTSFGPLECEIGCRAFSAPDLDADGTSEVLVVQMDGTVVGLGLFDVQIRADGPALQPVTVAPPGDPAGGFDPGAAVRLLLGGDEFYLYTLRCGDPQMHDGPGLIYTAAESLPHDSPDARWHAHRVTFALRKGTLSVMDVGDFTEPVSSGSSGPSFGSGETLCGSNLGP